MDWNECENCKYYSLHYVKISGKFIESGCGYCKYPRAKQRYAKTPACKNFVEKKTK